MQHELTYFSPRKCYKKKRKGIIYYVGKGSERNSDENYRRAWTEWEEVLARLIADEKAERDLKNAPRLMQIVLSEEKPDPEELDALGMNIDPQVMAILRRQKEEGRITLLPEELDVMLAEFRQKKSPQYLTLKDVVEKFLTHKQNQAKTGQKSVGRYATIRTYLHNFRDFIGSDTAANEIDASTINNYYDRQLEEIDAGKIGDYCARDRLGVVKQFIRWAWGLGYCEQPRNLQSRELSISVTAGEIQPMPVESLRTRVRAATGRLKVELLLMANCGMYQVDCADLRHAEVDWMAGTITRRRSKKQKGKEKSLPKVTYYLWASTLELLRGQATNDSPFVLATREGKQTVWDGFNEDGKPVRNDATGQAYRKFEIILVAHLNENLPKMSAVDRAAKLKTGVLEEIDGVVQFRRWPAKTIRKTSSTAIGHSKDFRQFAQYFLGQAPQSIADKHYIRPDEQDFQAACEWLGVYLGLATVQQVTLEEGSSL